MSLFQIPVLLLSETLTLWGTHRALSPGSLATDTASTSSLKTISAARYSYASESDDHLARHSFAVSSPDPALVLFPALFASFLVDETAYRDQNG